jgi:mannose-1-phosphate guanylyltransferase
VGILLPLLSIQTRDPEAVVVIMPSDHAVAREDRLTTALKRALAAISLSPDRIILLGVEPERPDPEYGWILPESQTGAGLRRVKAFFEKPSARKATKLIRRGALVNTLLVAAHSAALVELFQCQRKLLTTMRRLTSYADQAVLRQRYRHLPDLDFSRDVLERRPQSLWVLPVAACGWSDLGTPERVFEHLGREHAWATTGPEARSLASDFASTLLVKGDRYVTAWEASGYEEEGELSRFVEML